MKWDDLQSEKSYGVFSVYRVCKLANCLFTIELAKKFQGKMFSSYNIKRVLVSFENLLILQFNPNQKLKILLLKSYYI